MVRCATRHPSGGDVVLRADILVAHRPALAAVVEEDNPAQIKFVAVVDQNMGQSLDPTVVVTDE